MKVAFVGGGNMGRALAAALIGQGVCAPKEILVIEPDSVTRESVERLGCNVLEKPDETLGEVPLVLLAVKPQTAPKVFSEIKPHLLAEQVAVSIMAGVPLKTIKKGLGIKKVVRVMPNTPAQVGLGMNVYFPDPSVSPEELKIVESVLGASGEVLRVSSEDAIDAATAISGSGPAYVFFVAEHWMKAARDLGFTEAEAEQLVQQTLLGATALWRKENISAGKLREQVTSKGGTTAAALEFFEAKKIGSHLEGGIEKAYRRAKELGAG